MADTLSKAHRSARMALIRSKNTKPEVIVRKLVHSLGYRYSLRRRDLPGKPDLVFSSRGAVIFVHGCFWHQHDIPRCRPRKPKSRNKYWEPKFQRNIERDQQSILALRRLGWRVLVIW